MPPFSLEGGIGMSVKQDRTYIRTAEDLERKYNLGYALSEAKQIAVDARRTAENAATKDYVDTELAGKAPAGFGLGVVPNYITFAEADTTFAPGWYRFSGNITVNGATYNYAYMRVDGFNNTACTQILYIVNKNYKTFRRSRVNGTWHDWVDVTHTAFAPSGFGYGDEMLWLGFDKESWSSTGNFQADLEATFAAMPQGTCKQVQFIDANLSNQKFAGTLWKYTDAYGYLTADNYSGAKAIKTYYNSVWNDWEWENPPMVAGVEYRTTERYNNKVVYTRYVNLGSMPASGQKKVAYTSGKASKWVSYEAYLVTSSGNVSPMPYINTSGTLGATVYASTTNIVISAQYDISAHSGFAIVKYTYD